MVSRTHVCFVPCLPCLPPALPPAFPCPACLPFLALTALLHWDLERHPAHIKKKHCKLYGMKELVGYIYGNITYYS